MGNFLDGRKLVRVQKVRNELRLTLLDNDRSQIEKLVGSRAACNFIEGHEKRPSLLSKLTLLQEPAGIHAFSDSCLQIGRQLTTHDPSENWRQTLSDVWDDNELT